MEEAKRNEFKKVATTLEEAQSLTESGFEYVTDMKIGEMTYKLFCKKKTERKKRRRYFSVYSTLSLGRIASS